MPIRTNIQNWPAYRPDYWAGEKGGRPLPKPGIIPEKGDTLPRSNPTSYGKAFDNHSEAVAYAKLFGSHAQITVKLYFPNDIPIKRFIVNPRKGKESIVLKGYAIRKVHKRLTP